jgi:hypothetical protein
MLPFIAAACLIPMNQQIDIASLNFTTFRCLLAVAILKQIMGSGNNVVSWNMFDKLILLWSITGSFVYILQQANLNAVIYKSGVTFDCLGFYWLLRQYIRQWDDVFISVKLFAIFAILTAPSIVLEKYQQASFSIFGPVEGAYYRGRYRAAGPFPHYIILGCFWATLLPFFYAQLKMGKNNILYFLAIVAALSNVYCCASSTPIMTVIAIILFWNIYSYRIYGRLIFWLTCSGLLLLHLIMKAPVWHLLARLDVFSGSTGWHRYFLMDNFINNISQWFFLGNISTAQWGLSQGDITNQFILEALRGGIMTLVIFIILIYYAIKIPGKFSIDHVTPETQWISWAICVVMLGHLVTFWGVSYFGQIDMVMGFSFALIGFTLEQSQAASAAIHQH